MTLTKGFKNMSISIFILSLVNFFLSFREMLLYEALKELDYINRPAIKEYALWENGWVLFGVSCLMLLFSLALMIQSVKLKNID